MGRVGGGGDGLGEGCRKVYGKLSCTLGRVKRVESGKHDVLFDDENEIIKPIAHGDGHGH